MISYKPFWDTLKKKKVTTYDLIAKNGISSNTVQRIRKNKPITTKTVDSLCEYLGCRVSDIVEYKEPES